MKAINLISFLFLSCLFLTFACGDSNDDPAAQEPRGEVDKTSYSNTATKEEFSTKSSEAIKLYDNTDAKLDALNSAGSSTFTNLQKPLNQSSFGFFELVKRLEDETSESEEESSYTTSASTDEVNSDSLAAFAREFENCGELFSGIKSFSSQGKAKMTKYAGGATDPTSLDIGAGGNYMEVEELEDANSAFKYTFKAKEGLEGFDINGSISGGANETIVVFDLNLTFTADLAKILQSAANQSGASVTTEEQSSINTQSLELKTTTTMETNFAADLEKSIADHSTKGSTTVTIGDQSESVNWDSVVTVRAGTEEPGYKIKMNYTSSKASGSISLLAIFEDDNTLVVEGSSSDGANTYSHKYTITKTSDNTCAVQKS